jgi:hypothetical protein
LLNEKEVLLPVARKNNTMHLTKAALFMGSSTEEGRMDGDLLTSHLRLVMESYV